MESSTNKQIPCKYLVAKYVGDDIRNEPINVGIIIQSRSDSTIKFKFVTQFKKIRTATEEPRFLKQVLENIQNEIQTSPDKNIFDTMISKYQGKIRFTEPRATITSDLEDETELLYDRFISIEKQPLVHYMPIKMRIVKRGVYDFLRKFKKPVESNKWFEGQPGKFKWNFFIANKHLLHSISFDTNTALQTTKLYDWHAKDLIEHKKRFTEEDFSAVIIEPSRNNPKYPKMMELFKESKKIWDSRNYSLVTYDENNEWQHKLEKLI